MEKMFESPQKRFPQKPFQRVNKAAEIRVIFA